MHANRTTGAQSEFSDLLLCSRRVCSAVCMQLPSRRRVVRFTRPFSDITLISTGAKFDSSSSAKSAKNVLPIHAHTDEMDSVWGIIISAAKKKRITHEMLKYGAAKCVFHLTRILATFFLHRRRSEQIGVCLCACGCTSCTYKTTHNVRLRGNNAALRCAAHAAHS